MKSLFYSKTLFRLFIIIYTTAIAIVLFYSFVIFSLTGLISPISSGNASILFYRTAFFTCIIPVLYIISSMYIIIMQQRGRTKWDYFMGPLLIIPCAYFFYFLKNNVLQFFFFLPERSVYLNIPISIVSTILLLSFLIPFYALGKVLVRDLSKRKS